MNLKNDVEEIWEDLKRFEEMLDTKNMKNLLAPILLQNSLKPSLGQ